MFGKKRGGGPTVIGQGAVFEGTLRVSNGLQVDGAVHGDVEVEGGLTIGPEGALVGEVRADTAVVAGRVEGAMVTEGLLQVRASGRVEGQVSYGSLEVERGAELIGQTAHLSDGFDPAREEDEDDEPELAVAAAEA